MIARTARLLGILILLLVLAMLGLFLVTRQNNADRNWLAATGATPQIGAPSSETIPTIAIAKPTDWGSAAPTAPAGLKVRAFASGLDHPRWLYRLPNGDVLVAELLRGDVVRHVQLASAERLLPRVDRPERFGPGACGVDDGAC